MYKIKTSLVCIGLSFAANSAIFGQDVDGINDCPVSPIKKAYETPPWPLYEGKTGVATLITNTDKPNDCPTSPVKPVCPPWPD